MRQPAVADRFYPGSADELSKALDELFADKSKDSKGYGVIAPHAGYIFSGALAAKTLSSVSIPRTIILLGPNHHGLGAKAGLSIQPWQSVFGPVDVNQPFCDALLKNSNVITQDELSHRNEHSLEVQIPLLQRLRKEFTIVPVSLSHISYSQCKEIAKDLVKTIKETGEETLLLASSDMSHYESRKNSKVKDQMALDQVEKLDAEALYNTVYKNRISMCGVIPAVITILASLAQGASEAKLIGYTDSGNVTGDVNQVVGYAGVVFR